MDKRIETCLIKVIEEVENSSLSQFPHLAQRIKEGETYGVVIIKENPKTREEEKYVLIDMTKNPEEMEWETFRKHGLNELLTNFHLFKRTYTDYHIKNLVNILDQIPS